MKNRRSLTWRVVNLCLTLLVLQLPALGLAQDTKSQTAKSPAGKSQADANSPADANSQLDANPQLDAPERDLLDATQWQRIDESVVRSLEWLSDQQKPDGSFPTVAGGQPAVTSLCVMAFASHGHLPGQGKYGKQLEKAIEYIIGCQKRSGILALECPNTEKIPRTLNRDSSNNAVYNHAISATVLSEMYSLASGTEKQGQAIEKALAATLTMQKWPKNYDAELGGWRYLNRETTDVSQSDLSVTAWQVMFLRSAKNSGFDVPAEPLADAVKYVLGTFNPKMKTFSMFDTKRPPHGFSRGMAGAGILALAHSGVHNRPENIASAEFMLRVPCVPYGKDDPLKVGGDWYPDRYHYSAFIATQAMYQMGGKYWKQHFPPTAEALVANQSPDGSWPAEKHQYDARFGNAYTTALVALALGAPNQLLPVFQR